MKRASAMGKKPSPAPVAMGSRAGIRRKPAARDPLKEINRGSDTAMFMPFEISPGCLPLFPNSSSSSSSSSASSAHRFTQLCKTPKSAPNTRSNYPSKHPSSNAIKPIPRNSDVTRKIPWQFGRKNGSKAPKNTNGVPSLNPSKNKPKVTFAPISPKEDTHPGTPPLEASVSPEIQFVSPKSNCYAAGFVMAGLPGNRKCKPRGVLTVGDDLEFSNSKASDRSHIVDGASDRRLSIAPAPAEASICWFSSPCRKPNQDQGNDSGCSDISERCSLLSIASLNSGNLVQTPHSGSDSDKDYVVTTVDQHDMSFKFASASTLSNSVDLTHFIKTINIQGSPICHDSRASESENVGEPPVVMSWEEGFEMEESEFCRCFSDEDEDAAE